MSTTWTSIITNEDGTPQTGVTIGLESGNYTFDGAGNSGTTPLPGGSTGTGEGIPFSGLIATGDTFKFGDESEFAVGTSDGSTLSFNLTTDPLPSDVIFNFNDALKVYGNGVLGLTNLDDDPDPSSHENGSIVMVQNEFKILKGS